MSGSPITSLFSLYATQATYNFSDQELEAYPTYLGNLTGPISIEKSLPELFTGIQQKRSAEIRISNINNAIGTEGSEYGTVNGTEVGYGDYPYGGTGDPTISEISSAEDLRGKRGQARIRDVETNTDFITLDGVVTSVRKSLRAASLTLESSDTNMFTELIPKTRVLDIYPDADLTTVRDPDAPVIVLFGEMRKVDLGLVTYSQSIYGSAYDYGLIRKPQSGTYWTNALYRNNRVISSSEYSLVERPTGYYVYRFSLDQRDTAGSLMRIQADIGAGEFTRPSQAAGYVLTQELRGSIQAASFSGGSADYAALSYRTHGGLRTRRPAGDVLNQLLLHGAVLDRDSGGAYTIAVDKAALHTAGTPQLGVGDNNWENVVPNSISDEVMRIEERLRKLTLNGLFDPGFEGDSGYLLNASRFRNIEGVELVEDNQFIGDATTLDTECDYRFKRLAAADRKVTLKANLETRTLGLNQLVSLYVPNLGFGGDRMEIRGIGYEGGGGEPGQTNDASLAFDLRGYSSGAFTYTPGVVNAAPVANSMPDYSFTPPGNVIGFQVVSYIGPPAIPGSIALLQAQAPSANVNQLVFAMILEAAPVFIDQNIQPAQPNQVVQVYMVIPTSLADIWCFARNTFSKPGFQDGIPSVID